MTRPEDFRGELDDGFDAAEARIRARIEELTGNPLPAPPVIRASTTAPDPLAELDDYTAPAPQRPRPGRRRWIGAAAAAVVVIGGIVAANRRTTTSPSAPPSIEQLAQAAAAVPADTDGVEVLRTARGPDGTESTTSIMMAPNGELTTTLAATNDPAAPPVGWQDPAAAIAGFSGSDLQNLPTDPDEMAAAVADHLSTEETSVATATALAEISAMTFLPPAVRAAAVAGLEIAGGVAADEVNGEGLAVIQGDGWIVLVDPATGTAAELVTGVGDAAAVTRWTAR